MKPSTQPIGAIGTKGATAFQQNPLPSQHSQVQDIESSSLLIASQRADWNNVHLLCLYFSCLYHTIQFS